MITTLFAHRASTRCALALLGTAALALAGCAGDDRVATSTTSATTSTSTTATTATPTSSTAGPTTTAEAMSDPVAKVSIESGPSGVSYVLDPGGNPVLGPSLIALSRTGELFVDDPVGDRILAIEDGMRRVIDIASLEAAPMLDLEVDGDTLLLLYLVGDDTRISRLTFDGTVLETIDVPPGFGADAFVDGVLGEMDGRIVTEYELGGRRSEWDPELEQFIELDPLTVGGRTIESSGSDLIIDGVTYDAGLSDEGLGGLRFRALQDDGTVIVAREDVLSTDPVFDVLSTVEWYSPTDILVGSAYVDLEQYYPEAIGRVAVSPAGPIWALVTRPDGVDIVRLERVPFRLVEAP